MPGFFMSFSASYTIRKPTDSIEFEYRGLAAFAIYFHN